MTSIRQVDRRIRYRQLAILLRRECKDVNVKKAYQLYREERLTAHKRALGIRAPIAISQ